MTNLFDDYFNLLGETESPAICHRWSLATCISALIGKQAWIPFGSGRIFPNMYVMIMGASGTRKSTAIKLARKYTAKAGYANFSAQRTTKEKFLLDLEGLELGENEVGSSAVMENLFGSSSEAGGDPKEVFIVADEFNDFMTCGDSEFQSLLGSLWDWDDETLAWSLRLKNSKSVSIYQPTISLLAGNNRDNFALMFPPSAIGQGFLSRMLLIHCEPTGKKIPIPLTPNESNVIDLVNHLKWIKEKFIGAVSFTPKALEIYSVLYNTQPGIDDIRFDPYNTRRHVHLMKMCMVCAAASKKLEIGVPEVVLANSILSFAEHSMPKALGEFGKARNNDVGNSILAILAKNPTKPVTTGEIFKQVSSNLDRPEDMLKIITGLVNAEKIMQVKGSNPGFMLRNKVLGEKQLYVNYQLLKEYRDAKL